MSGAGRLAEAWALARQHTLPDHILLDLAKVSEAALPAEAAVTYRMLAERQIGLTNRHGYEAACRLLGRRRHRAAAGAPGSSLWSSASATRRSGPCCRCWTATSPGYDRRCSALFVVEPDSRSRAFMPVRDLLYSGSIPAMRMMRPYLSRSLRP